MLPTRTYDARQGQPRPARRAQDTSIVCSSRLSFQAWVLSALLEL